MPTIKLCLITCFTLAFCPFSLAKLQVTTLQTDGPNQGFSAYESNNIDMWRGTKKNHFVRPKWGFYRSLKSKEMLTREQDAIRFADFKVIK